ncbi:MAG: sugar ABC transporter substrate-binding protein [Betaproteobacteria bacterium]|nr:MAG: sugar ABC transporter substrate-binding protein [Betaproteobacteria bacterium]
MKDTPVPAIAVFTKNRLNPAYHGARIAAERVAARNGAQVMHYVPQKPDDVDEQIALIEQAIAARPAAMVLVPVHLTAIDGAVRKVKAAGIPIFNCINRLQNAADYVTFVGADDTAMTTRVARRLFREMQGQGSVVILEGTPGTVTARDRLRGFLQAAGEFPRIRVLGTRSGSFLFAEGRSAMRALLDAHPRIDGVLACNDSMALGAIEALREARRTSLVVGVNAVPEAVEALKAGTLLATADFDAFKIACLATEAAVRHLRGEPVPKEILPPIEVVDRSNCARWDCPMEARECPDWHSMVDR